MPDYIMKVDDITICASDDFALAATLFSPQTSNGRALIIHSAMGVKRRYYTNYAQFMQAQGFTVLTYDYRGVGDSRPASLSGFSATLCEWGAKDADAAILWMVENQPTLKLMAIGHSVGGQILGLSAHNQHITAFLGVACQSGYWRGWPDWNKLWVLALWYGIIPVSCAVLGYYPARWFRAGENLPAGVALEWASAGRKPRYLLDMHGGSTNDHYAAYAAPLRLYSFTDDRYAPPSTVEALLPLYPNAQHEHRRLSPHDLNTHKIGHFGFFRRPFEETLWMESADWLKHI